MATNLGVYGLLSSPPLSVLFVTVSSAKEAKRISVSLVENRLAACVNIIPSVQSVYKWNGELNMDDELLLIIKTKSDLVKEIEKQVRKLHTYETPEILSFSVDEANKKYLDWIESVL